MKKSIKNLGVAEYKCCYLTIDVICLRCSYAVQYTKFMLHRVLREENVWKALVLSLKVKSMQYIAPDYVCNFILNV